MYAEEILPVFANATQPGVTIKSIAGLPKVIEDHANPFGRLLLRHEAPSELDVAAVVPEATAKNSPWP
jgi:hypothetical protein